MTILYDANDANSIIDYAKSLKGKTLRKACKNDIENHGYKGKGNFGRILEKYYFRYKPNSDSEADFKEVGIELKTSPLKILKNGEYRSKERLVLNIINYFEVHKEDFEISSFWKKNSHLLLIFYLYDTNSNLLDYVIKLVDDWKYPKEDIKIIKNDWAIINRKIKSGKAHEISEGDTFYLAACTKGSTALKSYRNQPFNSKKAKQRAYSFKQGYVNHIIAKIAKKETSSYGKIIKQPKILDIAQTIEKCVISKFQPYYEKSPNQIEQELGLDLNKKAKSYFASLTKAILGIDANQRIEEFEKANIIIKTVRLKENNLPKEDISFKAFKYKNLIETNWEQSDFKNILESKFFFVFYQFKGNKLILKKVKFWNMPYLDIIEAKKVWEQIVQIILDGIIVQEITNRGQRKTFFPKKTQNKVSHVRPHARDKNDTYVLPISDKLTGETEYTKHCFWLNSQYIRDEVYFSE